MILWEVDYRNIIIIKKSNILYDHQGLRIIAFDYHERNRCHKLLHRVHNQSSSHKIVEIF